jgi:signal transduction histidine kinase/CheY-like chemotaxis protein
MQKHALKRLRSSKIAAFRLGSIMIALWSKLIDRIPLAREYVFFMKPAVDLSAIKHVQLLKMTHERLVYSFTAMPWVATFSMLFYCQEHYQDYQSVPMAIWAIGYCLAYWFSQHRARAFEHDEKNLDAQVMFDRWYPRLMRVATLHGLALCLPFILTAQNNSFEFTTLWYLVLAAILAGNATHQTPALGIFVRFFNCSWNLATVLSIIAYPNHWYYITPMILMHTFGIYRHALMAHKFFLQQVRLEESSNKLAEQFKIAKDAAEDALRSKNQFLATASHDLRQPAHAMSMLIEAISNRNRDASLSHALADLRSSLRSMNLMFNSLLDLSKLESGVIAVERKPVHLQSFLHKISAMFEHEARDRQLQLRLHLPKEPVIVHTDPNLLRQVVMNLLQNALRYTERGGVLLAIRRRGQHWQVEVCDTGIGVAEEAQMDIYLPYFRQEHVWDVQSEGHGLGLSVVARCALLLKAPIEMKSRLGRGSRFWISLPRLVQTELQSDKNLFSSDLPNSDAVLRSINRGYCLIVEDDPQVSRAWQLLMQSWGVDTRLVTNSAEALACLDTGFKPHVILCDERLRAGESGFELLQVLMARFPDAHGAMVSGEFDSPALRQAEDEGYLVFRKPLEIHLIHDVLNRWL